MLSLIKHLTYTTDDQRHKRSNPSKIPFDGDKRKNLASYKAAVELYRKFIESRNKYVGANCLGNEIPDSQVRPEEDQQRVGLERDLQASLRTQIQQIEQGMTIIDDGVERRVDSGFIDITARDSSGEIVVIELKAGVAGPQAITQALSYMGDVLAEEEGCKVRGILIAAGFDAKSRAARV